MANLRIFIGLVLGLTSFLSNAYAQQDTTSTSSRKSFDPLHWPLSSLDALFPLGNPATQTTTSTLDTATQETTDANTGPSFTDMPTLSGSSSSITTKVSSDTTSSSRAAGSGFWTGSDPFSFIWPSSLTSSLNKSGISRSTDLSSTSSSTANGSSVTSHNSSTSVSTATDLSTSTSIQVTYVTASPVPPPALSSIEPQTSNLSSLGKKNGVNNMGNGILIGLVAALLIYRY